MHHHLKYALEKNTRRIVNINDVDNGLLCNCICPYCKQKLVAKNDGLKREHHFAHYLGIECKGARMSTLHLLAQQIIEEKKEIMLPDYQGEYYEKETKSVKFDDIWLEKTVEDLRPDCICIKRDNRGEEHKLWVEILVTHEVDDAKQKKIQAHKVACIEIDLSDLIDTDYSEDSITHRLQNEKENKRWVNCPQYDEQNAKLKIEYEKEESKRLQREKERREKAEAEQRQKEAARQVNDEYLKEKSMEWYKSGRQETAQLLIDEINKEPFCQNYYYESRTQNIIFHTLLPRGDFLYYIENSAKNEVGLRLFYTLLHYYYDHTTKSDFSILKHQLQQFQYSRASLSREQKIHLEQLISLRIIYLLEKSRNHEMYIENIYKNIIKKYILKPYIRNEVLMVSSVFCHHILGSDAQSFGELTNEIIQKHPYLTRSYLTIVNKEKFKKNYFLGGQNMLDVLARFVAENTLETNETVERILRVCFSYAFKSDSKEDYTVLSVSKNPPTHPKLQFTYQQPVEDLKNEKGWRELNDWYKNSN